MRFRFSGFEDSAKVTLSASQQGATQTASVEGWKDVPEVSFDVKRSVLQIYPETIMFSAQVKNFYAKGPEDGLTFDDRFHAIDYKWRVTRADGTPYTPTYDVAKQLLPSQRDASVGFGPSFAHTFREAGQYKVLIQAKQPGPNPDDPFIDVEYEHDIIVRDHSEVYVANSQTLHIDPDGIHAGVPLATRKFTSFRAAMLDIRDGNYPYPQRIQLAAGKRFEEDWVDFDVFGSNRVSSIMICSDGASDEKPVISFRGATAFGHYMNLETWVKHDGVADLSIHGVRFEGGWDSTTETGNAQSLFWQGGEGANCPDYFQLFDCEMSGFAINLRTHPDWPLTFVSDCLITNWQDYGVFSTYDTMAIIGTRIMQDVNALSGGNKTATDVTAVSTAKRWNQHGPIRLSGGTYFIMDGCDLFSRNGWFINIPNYHTQQPCLRWNQAGYPNAQGNIQRTTMEGGYTIIDATRTNFGEEGIPHNLLIDRCLMIGSHMTSAPLEMDSGGTTCRNTLMILPNLPSIAGLFLSNAFIRFKNAELNAENTATQNAFYNNTFVNLRNDAHGGDLELMNNRDLFTNVIEQDNVFHQPNQTDQPVLYDRLSTDPVLIPREDGYISDIFPVRQTQYASPHDMVALYHPISGSNVLGTITGHDPLTLRDFEGDLRPDPASIGAFELPQT